MKIVTRVCDACEDRDKEATTFTLTREGQRWIADLCEDDAKPLLDIMAAYAEEDAPTPNPVRSRRGRRSTRSKISTPEEIERLREEYLAKHG